MLELGSDADYKIDGLAGRMQDFSEVRKIWSQTIVTIVLTHIRIPDEDYVLIYLRRFKHYYNKGDGRVIGDFGEDECYDDVVAEVYQILAFDVDDLCYDWVGDGMYTV